ncbi:T7SS effector LXG polymorphic toxin [Streptococcus mitis]|uniref:LXG domain-containing protein n=1 Tax=Streptococcus mitis TaxID=28037 RepID=A0A1X1JX44_STRMT|nr:T7SS effector LXG polymorphic toxin [Streptococcus mitis]ORO91698.1 hypothetical protein B7700_09685 [Streptococcus mitis]
MGIKVDIGSADSQGSTANSVLSSRVNYYNDVISAFNNLITEEELKGEAYDSAKSYAENIMVPLLRGVILFSESLGGKAGELPTLYHSQVGGESLDEEILQQQIEAKNTIISTYESILYSLYNLKDVDPIYISNVRGIISNATSKRDELQRKLEKLQSFASSTSGQFSDSESLQSLVFQGFEQVTGDFGKFDGTFKVEGQASWANTINSEWKKRSEVVQNYQNVLDKIKNKTELDENDIKSIAEYRKRYPGKELPDTLVNAIEQHLYEKILAEVLGDDGVKYNTINLYDAIKTISDNDWFKRGAQILGLTPKNLTKAFLQSDGVIELLGSVDKGTKGRKFVSGVMSAMARYESLGNKGGTLKKIFDGISDIASPVETIVKTGLEGARDAGMAKFGKYIKGGEEATGLLGKGLKYFPKVAKVMGKVGTVTTFADLGITAISSGVDEYSKTKDIGKAAGKGALSAIASVGPLEGATIGAAIGGIPGAAVGVFVGGVIQGIKAWKPQFFDDPVKGTKEMIDDIGNGIKGTVKNISNGIGGIGKALGFG